MACSSRPSVHSANCTSATSLRAYLDVPVRALAEDREGRAAAAVRESGTRRRGEEREAGEIRGAAPFADVDHAEDHGDTGERGLLLPVGYPPPDPRADPRLIPHDRQASYVGVHADLLAGEPESVRLELPLRERGCAVRDRGERVCLIPDVLDRGAVDVGVAPGLGAGD